jgi:hypothetical protein
MLLWDVAPCRVSRSRALGKRMKTETQLKICSCSVVATRPGLLWSQVTHGPDRGRGTARSLLLSPLILVVQVPSLCYFSLSLSLLGGCLTMSPAMQKGDRSHCELVEGTISLWSHIFHRLQGRNWIFFSRSDWNRTGSSHRQTTKPGENMGSKWFHRWGN